MTESTNPSRHLLNLKVRPTSKNFEALHNSVLDRHQGPIALLDVQTEVGHMYDELQWTFETFQWNLNKLTLNVKRKKFMHSWQMTLHDMFKQ